MPRRSEEVGCLVDFLQCAEPHIPLAVSLAIVCVTGAALIAWYAVAILLTVWAGWLPTFGASTLSAVLGWCAAAAVVLVCADLLTATRVLRA